MAARKRKGEDPLTFGMTFPYSTHNYQLRFWMASGGVDPDEDIRLVVLPPPSWWRASPTAMSTPSAWGRRGIPSPSISASPTSCTSCPRSWSARPRRCSPCAATGPVANPDVLARLVRAHAAAADFVENLENREEVCRILSAPNRIGVAPDVIRRTLDGRLKVAPDGDFRSSERYLLVGRKAAGRPDPVQARLALCADGALGAGADVGGAPGRSRAVFRPDVYDEVLGAPPGRVAGEPADGIGAFAGPPFDPRDIAAHLAPWQIRRRAR